MPTITKLKTDIQAQIAPGNDTEFLRLVQEADIRLLEMGRWRWCRRKGSLTIEDGYVTLDPEYASILGVRISDRPVDIHTEEYEFVPDGVGYIPIGESGNYGLIDQGLNGDGRRHYKVTGSLPADTAIAALMLFAPVTLFDAANVDSSTPEDAVETTLCPSTAAIKLACFGIIFEEAHDLAESGSYFNRAVTVLDDLEQNQRGNARPQMTMKPVGRGIRGIRTFR